MIPLTIEFPANTPAGDVSCINVTVIDDGIFEDNEVASILATNVTGTDVIYDSFNSDQFVQVTIIDDDSELAERDRVYT